MNCEIIQGDCLEVMRSYPDNHFSCICTDPPYGLSFMGKGWDHAVPGIEYWRECLRIIKAGGFLVAMGGTRTFHRLTGAIEDAGFEIRDCLSWLYGSGFPKSHNSFGLQGYGTALKPAWEPCILAMKPLDGTFAQNAEKWGQAGINIDGCRVGQMGGTCKGTFPNKDSKGIYNNGLNGTCEVKPIDKGRWPANVILDEEAGRMLDEQSGLEASRFFYCAKTSSAERNEGLEQIEYKAQTTYPEMKGTASHSCNRQSFVKNNHPTVKPLKLMEYLIKLVMPPKDGILLDPFAGSGTTILAAHRLGLKALGIEKQPEYAEIARARLAHASEKAIPPQMDLFETCN
jgi:DNA modification methylase